MRDQDGRQGTLRGALDARLHALEWPVHEAGIELEMRVAQAAQGGLEHLEGTLGLWLTPLRPQATWVAAAHTPSGAASPSAAGSGMESEPVRFATTFAVQPTESGEAYRVEVSRVGLAQG